MPWLHAEAARRMAERLAVVVRRPAVVLDWSGPAGACTEVLRQAYPRARLVSVDLPARRPAWFRRRGPQVLAADAVVDGTGELVWSNMALHWEPDPAAAIARWHRALAVDGFLMFSTLGPGSLDRLRAVYARQGWGTPHAAFIDMHDLGDMLVGAGFADPVMDQETLTLHWSDAAALLADLRAWGGNVDARRFGGLRTPRWRDRLHAALGAEGGQRPGLHVEIVYGHAFRAAPRTPVARESRVALADMRSILRGRRES